MMKINLNALFERQRKFDEFIHKKHQLTYKKVFMETKLALFVELAELANEVKSFKFWSIKGSGPKEKNFGRIRRRLAFYHIIMSYEKNKSNF